MSDERSACSTSPPQPSGVEMADALVTALLANDNAAVMHAIMDVRDPVVREALIYLGVSLAQLWERCEENPRSAWAQALIERELA